MKLQIFGIHAECNVDNIMPNSQMKLRCDEQLNTNIYKHTQKPKKKIRELTMKLRSLKEFGHRSGLKERERGYWLDKQIPLTVQSWVRLYKTISLIPANTNCSSLSNSNSNKTHFYWNIFLSLSLSFSGHQPVTGFGIWNHHWHTLL